MALLDLLGDSSNNFLGDYALAGLTENQRGLVTTLSGLLIYFAAAPQSIVPDGPYAPAIRFSIGMAGVAGLGLQKFLQADPQTQQTIIEEFKQAGPLIQKFYAMTPDQQKAVLTLLELEAPVKAT